MSDDGRFVVWYALISLLPGNNISDASSGIGPSISHDGHWVSFSTMASNIMYETWDTLNNRSVYTVYVP